MEEGLVAATVTAAYNNGEDSPHPEMAPEEVAGVERNGAEESFDTNNMNMPDGSNATEPRDLPENELEGIRKENEKLTGSLQCKDPTVENIEPAPQFSYLPGLARIGIEHILVA